MKRFYTLVLLCLGYFTSYGQTTLLTEHFNYPADSLLQSNGWFSHSAPATNPIRVRNGGLSWATTPYLGSGIGNAAAVNNTGSDENRPFSSSVTSGNVYMSFLMRVNGAVTTTNAGFFLHSGAYASVDTPVFTLTSSNFRARTFIAPAPTAAQYKLGLEFNLATTTNTTATNLDTGVTYLVVVKYQFVPGANNDSVSLYVFTDGSNIATEPAVAAIGPLAGSAADAAALQYIALRQYNASQNITVDGIIVQTTWNLLPPPTQTALPITWDNPAINYVFTDFGGNISNLAPSPTDSTNTTLRTIKTAGAQTWAGTTLTPPPGLTTAIPFATGATTLSVKVHAPASGIPIRLKAETAGNPTLSVETETNTTAAGWQTLVFNFANQATGTAAINFATTYNMLSIFYGFGNAGTGAIFFADSVFFGGTPLAPPPPPINLPITWDNTALTYSFTDFGGNVSALAPSPTDSTNTTLRSIKTAGAQTWAGTTITPGTGLGSPIPFAAGATRITVKVHAPAAGIIVRLKAEQAGVASVSVETEDTTTAAGWQLLEFNFANQATGTAAINFASTYNVLSIFYGFGSAGTGATFYADSVFFGGGPVGPPPVVFNLPITWDNAAITYSFTDFGGNASALAPSPTDTTNTTLRSVKTAGAQTWAGTTITPATGLSTPIPFTASATSISVKVHAPASGILVRLKAEQAGVPTISVETDATTTGAGWQTLVFNFANPAAGTAALNITNTYNVLSIFYGFGSAGTGATFYADSVFFGGGPVGPPPVPVNLPITWDNPAIPYSFTDFGGNVSALAPSPTNATNTTLRSIKTAGAETWAGTTITPVSGLGTPIPFAAGATTLSVRVHAPASGVIVRLKAEQAGVPTISVETEATTSTTGWQTLVFNFANQATGTAAINFANTYNVLSIFYGFGTTGTGATFYADSVFFGGTVVTPQPKVSVTFRVDMSRETVSANGVHIAGSFQGWSPNTTPMVSQGNGIYTYTAMLDRNATYEYKFINGNQWGPGFDESVPAACAQNGNRFVVVDTSTITIPIVCFGRCEACGVSVFEAGSLNQAIRMYPNPSNAETNIAYEFQTPSDLNVTVYDARGKMITQINEKAVTNGSIKLNVQGWAEGIYHVRMFNGFEQIARQLVVTK
ncbi:MAG: T9SS type A sorting domain-containing protein [Sphingobacteriaceae bacterium]|nr:T9SS type A sorting domain-containing protein [Sphingobacteriaceae bacterium]